MTLHREGTSLIISTFVILATVVGLLFKFSDLAMLNYAIAIVGFAFFIIIVQFFRIPSRIVQLSDTTVLSPADGRIVVIEQVEETEYFNDKRLLVSVFMSPFNVHANYTPCAGTISYYKYHAGLFLAAWLPKSSTENERTTTVIKRADGQEILFRQVAGALAKRIKTYTNTNYIVKQAQEFGFIKFGSRVDVYLPLDAKIKVTLEQTVRGRLTVLAELPLK